MPRFTVRRLAIVGFAAAVTSGFWCGGGASVQAQQLPSAFLSVLNSNGEPVTDLQPSQVSMTLDGAACTSITLEPINWPMKLIVLLDNGDVTTNDLPTIREGVHRLLAEVPDGVESSLVTLAPQPRTVVRPTVDRQEFWHGIDLVIHSGSAKVVEGLAEAADRISQEKGNFFFTILVVTTNGPETSGGDVQQMFNRLRAQLAKRPVTVHAVMLSISNLRNAETASGSPVGAGTSRSSIPNSRAGLALKNTGALQTQVSATLTKDTGGRYENVAVASDVLKLLPEYGQQIARSHLLQTHEYRVSCGQSPSKAPQMAVFTSYPGSRGIVLSRDGHMP